MKKFFVGIDMGGTNTGIAIVNKKGEVLIKNNICTNNFIDAKAYAVAIVEEIQKMQLNLGVDIQGIGIGAPNGNFYAGTIEYAPNLIFKGVIPLAFYIEDLSGVKTLLTNDANAAALGEYYFGDAKNMKDFIVITLGTGVGTGVFANSQLIYGKHGFAGEAGHLILYPEGRPCACGRKGCFETYCNIKGIITTYNELSSNSTYDISPKIIFEKAQEGDKYAIETYRRTGEVLGLALANLICVFNPEAIFLFGGIVNAGNLLIQPALKSLNKNVLPLFKGKTQILKSGLNQNDAAVLGAASLCFL